MTISISISISLSLVTKNNINVNGIVVFINSIGMLILYFIANRIVFIMSIVKSFIDVLTSVYILNLGYLFFSLFVVCLKFETFPFLPHLFIIWTAPMFGDTEKHPQMENNFVFQVIYSVPYDMQRFQVMVLQS